VRAVDAQRRRSIGRPLSARNCRISGSGPAWGDPARLVLARDIIHDTRHIERRRVFVPRERPDLAPGGDYDSRTCHGKPPHQAPRSGCAARGCRGETTSGRSATTVQPHRSKPWRSFLYPCQSGRCNRGSAAGWSPDRSVNPICQQYRAPTEKIVSSGHARAPRPA